MDLELLRARAALIRQIRHFFESHNYLEVDTPLLSEALIPESCLEVFRTVYRPPEGFRRPERELFLIPSPELWMKRLLAKHRENLFQICHCFRNGETTGRWHSPEFTMLEYYTVGANSQDSLLLSEELFRAILPKDAPKDLCPPFRRLSMAEAFEEFAGFSLFETAEKGPEAFATEARKLGLETAHAEMGLADLFNMVFVHAVEDVLPKDRPLVLYDYPAFVPTLARRSPENPNAVERWELYLRGIEIANCYSEEEDEEKVRAFILQEAKEKEKSFSPHPPDLGFIEIFKDFPRSSGVALGLDRLFMALSGRSRLDSVLPFPLT